MKTWQQLLEPTDGSPPGDFGPNTAVAIRAANALRDADWYRHVGKATEHDAGLTRVHSWSEALSVFGDDTHYVWGGALIGPWDEMHSCDKRFPERHSWWTGAAQLLRPEDIRLPTLKGATLDEDVLVTDYIYDFRNLVMMEIVFSDVTDCTYFREQLQWFHAGHFPCGWEGDWPVGKMRVF